MGGGGPSLPLPEPRCSTEALAGPADLADGLLGSGLQDVHDAHELPEEVVPHHPRACRCDPRRFVVCVFLFKEGPPSPRLICVFLRSGLGKY